MGGGLSRYTSVQMSLAVRRTRMSSSQSSLSDKVSYCSESSDCHTRCWATGAPAEGGCCCWLCMEGEAIEVGGVLLNMRMVNGL